MKKTAAIFLIAVFAAACPSSAEEIFTKAPKFPRKAQWLHTKPLQKKSFKDKLTLVYFWDYTSINCIREFHFLKKWHSRYQAYGFQEIWVHAPEFDFAKKKENVEQAAARFDIPYPVVIDNDFKLWDAYGARSWPTKYLINADGRIVHTQVGQEHYLAFEDKIREELKRLDPSAVLPIPVLEEEKEDFNLRQCGEMSAETYMGHKRAGWWGGEIANVKNVLPDQTLHYRDRGKRVDRGFFVEGLWTNFSDQFEHARDTDQLTDYLGLLYLANEVYAVMNPTDEMVRVYVTRDERPVPSAQRGKDLREDPKGETYFLLQEPRLYYLIKDEGAEPHELKLWTQKKGVGVHSFSFSNHCLSDFDHL